MRSLVLALAFAAPVSAVAATPTYTNPSSTVRRVQTQEVFVTFVNHTSQEREVRIGNEQYTLRNNAVLHAYVPVGSVVKLFSNENSQMNGQELMQISASDANKSVYLK